MEPATSALPEESDAVPAASTLDEESLTEPEISDEEMYSLSAIDIVSMRLRQKNWKMQ